MNKTVFIKNSIILICSSLIINVLGFAFRIILANKIGNEGMGLYSLICTVYMFFAAILTTGISLAVTRLVTDNEALLKQSVSRYIVRVALFSALAFAFILSLVLYYFSDEISENFICSKLAVQPLKILSLSLPFMAVSACIRGYFYAKRNIFASAGEQLLEQIVEIVCFFILINIFKADTAEKGVCAVVLSTTIAEVISCIYAVIFYYSDVKDLKAKQEKGVLLKLYKITLPVSGSVFLRSGLSMLENILIPLGLRKHGADASWALSKYGEIVGMVMPVILFPNILLMCFSMLIIPEMSEANIKKNKLQIEYMSKRILRFSLLFSIPVCGFFMFYGEQLGVLIYSNQDAGKYIATLAPIVPLIYLDKIVDGMLKGLNEQTHYLIYNIIDAFLRVSLTFILLPIIGIKGVIIVLYSSAIINSGLSILRLLKVTQTQIDLTHWILKPSIATLFAGFISKFVLSFYKPWSIFGLVLFFLILFALLSLLKSIYEEELLWIKDVSKQTIKRRK